ncbi:hypothetical protein T459_14023 [Capsicum annuum]|uniref:Uncharacterized protein n=1 Tax=Capsicum annuum TaxID=4072 RepID=A0A2G2ZG91_CAPAN|nr:hypothetical protein T459_14023 [Capsicum annuum]
MEEMNIQEEEKKNASGGGIFSAIGSMLAPKHTTDEPTTGGGAKMVVDMDDTRAGKTAATSKMADQVKKLIEMALFWKWNHDNNSYFIFLMFFHVFKILIDVIHQ